MLSGVQKVSLEILQNLSNEEYEKWILFSEDMDEDTKKKCKNEFENASVRVVFMQHLHREICISDVNAFYEIYKFCKKERFDIVHTHSTKPGIIGRIAARLAGTKLIVHTVHGISFNKEVHIAKRYIFYSIEFFATFFCDQLVLVNKFYKKYYWFFRKKTITIYNGINFNKYHDSNEDKAKNGLIRILFIGRLDKQKNPLMLLEAAKHLTKKHKQLIFSFIGGGELWDKCNQYIQENGLEKFIILEGWKSNVTDYYCSHDIFCLPSIYEAFGLVFLEAGYFKLPTVATNVEGIPEVILDNQTGLLVPSNDSISLTNALEKLILNEDLRVNLGKNAKEWVTEQFPNSKMVNEYHKIYQLLA